MLSAFSFRLYSREACGVQRAAVFAYGLQLAAYSCIRVKRAACSVQLYLYLLTAYSLQLIAVFA
jgi:hypothetical protein